MRLYPKGFFKTLSKPSVLSGSRNGDHRRSFLDSDLDFGFIITHKDPADMREHPGRGHLVCRCGLLRLHLGLCLISLSSPLTCHPSFCLVCLPDDDRNPG